MAKYILFRDTRFYKLAPNETARDHWMTSPTTYAEEVSDDNYHKVAR